MTAKDYLEQNKKGFENDKFLKTKIEELVKEFKINTIVETGTYLGWTTVQFADMVEEVYTVEISAEYFFKSGEHLSKYPKIKRALSPSPDHLRSILPSLKDKTLLFFLDAHWGSNCPLLEELKAIANNGLKSVIAIHDWKVPGHPELGFDSYNGQDYELSWIKTSLDEIYGGENGYTVSYNSEAEGAKRGVIFITPKEIVPLVKYKGIVEKRKPGRPKSKK